MAPIRRRASHCTVMNRRARLNGHRNLLRNFAAQDLIVIGFLTFLYCLSLSAQDGGDATMARRVTGALLVVTISVVIMVRGEILAAGALRTITYRLGIGGPMLASYVALWWLLPALKLELFDPQLRHRQIVLGVCVQGIQFEDISVARDSLFEKIEAFLDLPLVGYILDRPLRFSCSSCRHVVFDKDFEVTVGADKQ